MDRGAGLALSLPEDGFGTSGRTHSIVGLAGRQLFEYPVARLPGEQIVSGREVWYFGMHYVIPEVISRPGTVIAVNAGGAVIPGLLSICLYVRNRLWISAIIATVAVAGVCHWLARPVPGLGIAFLVFVPPLSAAAIALLLSRRQAAPLAYISGSLGTLIGADLLNLDRVQGLGAPVASIGGAGTFDGIFMTGILAVLIASIFRPSESPDDRASFEGTHYRA